MAKKQFPASASYRIAPKRVLGAAIALLVFFLLLTSVVGLAQKYVAIRKRSTELKDEQATLTKKEATLSSTNAYLATPEGTEESLRQRYNYIKPGEQIIVVTPDTHAPQAAEQPKGIAHWWDELLRGLGIRKDLPIQ